MILSVAIPTYNRVAYLKIMLKSVLDQILAFNLAAEVELVISDNDSSDGTGDYVKKLISENPSVQIVYRKNEKNIGVVRNITKLVGYANGKYWMFYGDDDLMPENSLPRIVEMLKNNSEIPVFVFKQKDYSGIEKTEDLSIYDCAARYFYYMGNACTAADTALSKKNLEKHYDKIVTTCWAQTHLYYLCMFESGLIKPVKICNLETYEGQPKNNNNIPNSFYHFDSQFYALLRVGYLISDAASDERFLSKFKRGIPFISRINYWRFLYSLIKAYKLFDLDNERKDFRQTLSEAYQTLKFRDIFYLIPFSISLLIPARLFFFIHVALRTVYKSIKGKNPLNFIKTFGEEKKNLFLKKQERIEKMQLKHAITVNRGEW